MWNVLPSDKIQILEFSQQNLENMLKQHQQRKTVCRRTIDCVCHVVSDWFGQKRSLGQLMGQSVTVGHYKEACKPAVRWGWGGVVKLFYAALLFDGSGFGTCVRPRFYVAWFHAVVCAIWCMHSHPSSAGCSKSRCFIKSAQSAFRTRLAKSAALSDERHTRTPERQGFFEAATLCHQ